AVQPKESDAPVKKNLINWLTPNGQKTDTTTVACNDGSCTPGTPDYAKVQPEAVPGSVPNTLPTLPATTPTLPSAQPNLMQAPMPTQTTSASSPAGAGHGKTSIPDDEAHHLLRQARKALAENRLEDCRKLLARARDAKTNYAWSELWFDPDQPDKVESDLRRAEGKLIGSDAVAKGPSHSDSDHGAPIKREDARAQVKRARELCRAGKLDDADKLAMHIKASAPGGWGLFEDSPEKIILDIQKLKTK